MEAIDDTATALLMMEPKNLKALFTNFLARMAAIYPEAFVGIEQGVTGLYTG